MKIIANKYSEADVFRMLREWSELTQKEFAESLGLKGITVQSYERGVRKYNFSLVMNIAKKYGYTITIEKKKI